MKILILNGSPRNQGLISQMLDIMTEEARIRGAEAVSYTHLDVYKRQPVNITGGGYFGIQIILIKLCVRNICIRKNQMIFRIADTVHP